MATSTVCLFSLFASLKYTFFESYSATTEPLRKEEVGTNLTWFKYDLSQNNWLAFLSSF